MGVVPGQPNEAAEVRTTSAVASYQQGGAACAGDLRAYGKACPVCSRGINILQQVSPSSLLAAVPNETSLIRRSYS